LDGDFRLNGVAFQRTLRVETRGRGAYELTDEVGRVVAESGVRIGLCVVSCMHTSASLLITENADPAVRVDLLNWLERVAPDGDLAYTHTAEGPDDMPAHIRSAVTRTNETLTVVEGVLALGTWQGLYLLEHRIAGHERQVLVHVQGEE